MKVAVSFLVFMQLLAAKLVPTPFMTDPDTVQRAGWAHTFEYFEKRLVGDTYGIAMTKPRGTNSTIMIMSDELWHRLLYVNLEEDSKQTPKYLRGFGDYGSGLGQFDEPKGLCIDTTVYNNDSNGYAIYVADEWNSRVTKLKYLISQDTIIDDSILVSGLNRPTDVACVSISGGGAYVVVVEKNAHRIRLYMFCSSTCGKDWLNSSRHS